MTKPTVYAVAIVVVGGATSASATLTSYSNRADFINALPGAAVVESFEDEAVDVQTGSRGITTSTSGVTYSGTATFGVSDQAVGGRGPTDGAQYLQVGFLNASSVLFQFDAPVVAFGIDVVDKNVNDLDALIDDLGINSVIDQGGEGNVQFWGVIASPDMAFTKVGFGGIGPSVPGDTFALDNMLFVAAVPEPSTACLCVGLAGAVWAACRRRLRPGR